MVQLRLGHATEPQNQREHRQNSKPEQKRHSRKPQELSNHQKERCLKAENFAPSQNPLLFAITC